MPPNAPSAKWREPNESSAWSLTTDGKGAARYRNRKITSGLLNRPLQPAAKLLQLQIMPVFVTAVLQPQLKK
jgi:hypothetical protein